MKLPSAVLGMALFFACGSSPPPCPPVPELWPAAGTGTPGFSGEVLVPSAGGQTLTISQLHDYAEFTFTRGGISYTARYALSKELPPSALPFVFVQRPQPIPACAALEGHGPIIDAIEVRRCGALISTGQNSYPSTTGCPGKGLIKPSPMDGPPDGQGAALGSATYFGWRLSGKVTLESGDEVTVTVLDSPSEPFEVFAGSSQTQGTLRLGALSGSGTLQVP